MYDLDRNVSMEKHCQASSQDITYILQHKELVMTALGLQRPLIPPAPHQTQSMVSPEPSKGAEKYLLCSNLCEEHEEPWKFPWNFLSSLL